MNNVKTNFEFATAGLIWFGAGMLDKSADGVNALNAMIVSTRSVLESVKSIEFLRKITCTTCYYEIPSEPTIEMIDAGVMLARENEVDLVIAIGGGSALDAGKAIAALLTNSGSLLDYLEVVGAGKPLRNRSVPMAAVPTTAGTGAEVTRNAVIGVKGAKVKVSLRSPYLLPTMAIVDPELTYSLPAAITSTTGMDALTQVIEPFVSIRANPLVDLYCQEGMLRAGRSLLKVFENGMDAEARYDMSFASLLGGLSLANAGLGAVHGFAGVIGGMFEAAHGAICARLLPFVIERNFKTAQRKSDGERCVVRYGEASRLILGNQHAKIDDLVKWLNAICTTMSIPHLSTYGMAKSDFHEIIAKAQNASSMKANPVQLEDGDLYEILDEAY